MKCKNCEFWKRFKDPDTGEYEKDKTCINSHSEKLAEKTKEEDKCTNYGNPRARNENFI